MAATRTPPPEWVQRSGGSDQEWRARLGRMSEHHLTSADIPARETCRQPAVDVRAEGKDGYVVVFHDPTGFPHDVRRFPGGTEGSAQARAYRDGFADGLVRSPQILRGILGS